MARLAGALIAAVFVMMATPAIADDNAAANRLIVEAAKLVEQAKSTKDAIKQVELLNLAERNLTTVVDKYPGSTFAVLLATGQPIGSLSLQAVRVAKAQAQKERMKQRCVGNPNADCLFGESVSIARNIPREFDHSYTLRKIALLQAKLGRGTDAKVTIGHIRDEESRSEARSELRSLPADRIRKALLALKELSGSVALGEVSRSLNKIRVLLMIARMQAKHGDRSGATSTLREVYPLVALYFNVAQAFSAFDILASFSETSIEARFDPTRDDDVAKSDVAFKSLTFGYFANALTDAGQTQRAKAAANRAIQEWRQISGIFEKSAALPVIVQALVKAGEAKTAIALLAETESLTRSLPPKVSSIYSIVSIGVAQRALDHEKEARKSFGQALRIVETTPHEPLELARTLEYIGRFQTKSGKDGEGVALLKRALGIVTNGHKNPIEYSSDAFYSFLRLAFAFGRIKLFAERQAIYERLEASIDRHVDDSTKRELSLQSLAYSRFLAGDVKGAVTTALKIQDAEARAIVVASMAAHLAFIEN